MEESKHPVPSSSDASQQRVISHSHSHSHSLSTPFPVYNNHGKRNHSPNVDFHCSSYYKIRSIVRDLRPHFIQLLQMEDFRNCYATYEIKKRMKVVKDLHKQITFKSDPPQKFASECKPLAQKKSTGKEPYNWHHEGKQAKVFEDTKFVEKSADKKPSPMPSHSEHKLDNSQSHGCYIVGGSAFGWNFITFSGKKPVYYGVTKESYRSTYPIEAEK